MAARRVSDYFLFLPIFLLLLLIIFDQQLGLVYSLMMIVSYFWFARDSNITYDFFPKKSLVVTLIEVGVAYSLFLGGSALLTMYIGGISFSSIGDAMNSVLQLLSTNTPILKGSKVLTFIGWGLLIPIIETTLFFGLLLEGFAERFGQSAGRKPDLGSYSKTMLVMTLLIAALFTAFHFTSKDLQLVPLMITFLFATISCLLVIRQRSVGGAITLHAISNSIVVITSLSVI